MTIYSIVNIASRVFMASILSMAAFNQANAHGRYILPSHTQLSGDTAQKTTLISSISNEAFHHDKPLGDDGSVEGLHQRLQFIFKNLDSRVIRPDGTIEPLAFKAYSRLSVSDLTLTQSGTHRVEINQKPMKLVTFINAKGAKDRVFGSAPIPEGATQITHRQTSSRVVSYISNNGTTIPTPNTQGLSLGGETHPNDLFSEEEANFQLFIDGKPLQQSAEVHWVREDVRHRNQPEEQEIITDEKGRFSIRFPQAGFYLLAVDLATPGTKGSGIDMHHNSLYITLEVFPQ